MGNFYHLSVENIRRIEGRSCVQMAGYISGTKLKDYRTGILHYVKKNEVVNDEILLPDCAPLSLKEDLANSKNDKESLRVFRERLWSSLEKYEKTNDAIPTKALDVAYPFELSIEQRKLCRDEFVKKIVDMGYAVEVADHFKEKNKNPHFHVLISVRKMDSNSIWSPIKEHMGYVCKNDKGDIKIFDKAGAIAKYNDENGDTYARVPVIDPKTGKQKLAKRNEKLWLREKTSINEITEPEWLLDTRKSWENIANQYLPTSCKISSDSYEKQGKKKIPTKHLGGAAVRMGEKSDRYQYNERVRRKNKELESIDKEIDTLQSIKDEAQANYEQSNMSVEEQLDLFNKTTNKIRNDEFGDLLGKNDNHYPHMSGAGVIANEREREAMRGIYGDDETTDKEI